MPATAATAATATTANTRSAAPLLTRSGRLLHIDHSPSGFAALQKKQSQQTESTKNDVVNGLHSPIEAQIEVNSAQSPLATAGASVSTLLTSVAKVLLTPADAPDFAMK